MHIGFHRGCSTCGDHTEADRVAAQRLSDAVNRQLTSERWHATEATNRWIACRLSDGVPDPTLYDTKALAVRHAPKGLGVWDRQCIYLQIPLTGVPPAEALHLLKLWRQDWLDTTTPVEHENPFARHPLTLPQGVCRP